jgi:predicted cupin superfamily sugar epimerase
VRSDEIWTHVEGSTVRLVTYDPATGKVGQELLGPFGGGDSGDAEPQRVVRAGVWQAAEPTGEFACGACFVGPGFDFADFVMLDADPETRAALERIDRALLRFA